MTPKKVCLTRVDRRRCASAYFSRLMITKSGCARSLAASLQRHKVIRARVCGLMGRVRARVPGCDCSGESPVAAYLLVAAPSYGPGATIASSVGGSRLACKRPGAAGRCDHRSGHPCRLVRSSLRARSPATNGGRCALERMAGPATRDSAAKASLSLEQRER